MSLRWRSGRSYRNNPMGSKLAKRVQVRASLAPKANKATTQAAESRVRPKKRRSSQGQRLLNSRTQLREASECPATTRASALRPSRRKSFHRFKTPSRARRQSEARSRWWRNCRSRSPSRISTYPLIITRAMRLTSALDSLAYAPRSRCLKSTRTTANTPTISLTLLLNSSTVVQNTARRFTIHRSTSTPCTTARHRSRKALGGRSQNRRCRLQQRPLPRILILCLSS